jgi:hypothetical protein
MAGFGKADGTDKTVDRREIWMQVRAGREAEYGQESVATGDLDAWRGVRRLMVRTRQWIDEKFGCTVGLEGGGSTDMTKKQRAVWMQGNPESNQ